MNVGQCNCQMKFKMWVVQWLHSYFFFNKLILETDNFHWDSFISIGSPHHPKPIEDIKVTSKKIR